MLSTVARAADAGFASRKDCAGVILYCAERATQCALQAIQTLGGNGCVFLCVYTFVLFSIRPSAASLIFVQSDPDRSYINDYGTGRILRDAKLYEIGAGTSEIRRMLIGRELFDETKDL